MADAKTRLMFTDIPAPTKSHLHSLANSASIAVTKINKADMLAKPQIAVDQDSRQSVKKRKELKISFDSCYNPSFIKSFNKPGQSSSQAYGVATENFIYFTYHHYIVALAIENKHCWTGTWLKNHGFQDVQCPGGHADCTADKPYLHPHSERRMACNIAKDLSYAPKRRLETTCRLPFSGKRCLNNISHKQKQD